MQTQSPNTCSVPTLTKEAMELASALKAFIFSLSDTLTPTPQDFVCPINEQETG